MIVNCIRRYRKDATISEIYIDGEMFGYCLEDIGRPANVKIKADTCIPEGVYRMAISFSSRFQREMTVIFNKSDDHSIERDGIRFTGIRVHGGNNVEHTAGCPLIGNGTNHVDSVWSSLEKEFTKRVKEALDGGETVLWIVSNSH